MAQTLANDGSSNLNSTGSGIKLRANSAGVPMSHDDVDTNFENLRAKINEVIGEVGTNTTKLSGIATGANNYSLPLATHTVRGGIELFSNTDQSVAANNVSSTANRTYGIQLNSANQAVVNVPWSNTTYNAASSTVSGLSKLGSNTQQNTAANNVTSTASRTYAVQHNSSDQLVVNVPWVDNNDYPETATSSTLGLVKIGYSENGKKYPVELSSGKMFVEVPWVNTDTNTTYTAGTGISISGTTISATGAGVTLDYYDYNDIHPKSLIFRISATGATGYPLITTAQFTTEHPTSVFSDQVIPQVTFPDIVTAQQYFNHHFGYDAIQITYRVIGTVDQTLSGATRIDGRNIMIQGWSGDPMSGSPARCDIRFTLTDFTGVRPIWGAYVGKRGNFTWLQNVNFHIRSNSNTQCNSIVTAEGAAFLYIDTCAFNIEAQPPITALIEAYDGSRVTIQGAMEANRSDATAHSANDMDHSVPLFYLATSQCTIHTPTDGIVFNGLFKTAVMENQSGLTIHRSKKGGNFRPVFWKFAGSKTIQGVTVPVYSYPDVVSSETTTTTAAKFYPAIEFRGLYNCVNFSGIAPNDRINLEYNLLGNYLRYDPDLGYPGANNETLSSVGLNAPVYNYIEMPVYKDTSGQLNQYSNGDPRYIVARHSNQDIYIDGASTRQATPETTFLLL